jgi:protein SCO1
MSPSRISLIVIVLAIAAIAGAWVARQSLQSPAPVELTTGTRISPAREIEAFTLVSHLGQPFERQALSGHWTLMFFGFTHCPDVCPATLATLVDARRRLDRLDAGELPQIVFVSVDPERDSPATLAGYVARFDPSVTGVTGSIAAIDAFASRMGVAHQKVPMSDGDYMVDHSAFVLLLDPQARQAAVFTPPHSAERLAADYLKMLGRG